MSRRNPLVALRQMLQYAVEARSLVEGLTFETFAADRRSQLAVVYALLVIGEAANRVERGIQDRHPAIPWSDVIGFRHKLVHSYDAIQLDIVWSSLALDVPGLIDQLRSVLAAETHS